MSAADPAAAVGSEQVRALASLLRERSDEILETWLRLQVDGSANRTAVRDTELLRQQSAAIVEGLRDGLERSVHTEDIGGPEFAALRRSVEEVSRRGARSGATPAETAHRVLALREAIGTVEAGSTPDSATVAGTLLRTSARIVDAIALLSFETYVSGREEIIVRQSQELLELSTPVVQLWEGVVAVPLIGTLDSARAQIVMETVLMAIASEGARVAILDITGVPTVDTLVAQHLLKTVTATKLMGADCIISGIRPQTAQTIVQLGIDLTGITTRATLADALGLAIERVRATTGTAAF